MTVKLLLDTHVVIRWFTAPQRLSTAQLRIMQQVERQRDQLGISAMTLLELAQLSVRDRHTRRASDETLLELERNPAFVVLPITIPIARQVPNFIGILRDPADCIIAATARVHGLRLLTSDQRIISANVVSTID